jgi:hypothetical protein
MKRHPTKVALVLLLFALAAASASAQSQQQQSQQSQQQPELKPDPLDKFRDEAIERAKGDPEVATRQLTNSDPLVRQRAAEELARLAPAEKRRLVEGYRLQEKNERVRLALDWASYRLGREESLYPVVRALGTNRYNQSQAYLAELDAPAPLHPFLSRTSGQTLARLLEALARSGDASTLELVRPHAASKDPRVADAARFTEREIARRLGQD